MDNRETRFSVAPTVQINRSKIPMKQRIWTTFNTGELVPVFNYLDGLPGDTFSIKYGIVCRETTALKPVMDDKYLDFFLFKIPWRILWDHFKEFCGENTNGIWAQQTEYLIPQLTTPAGGMQKGTIAEKMGIRINVPGIKFSAMGVRAYCLTWNEWFRDQNTMAPITVYKDDTDREASNTVSELGGPLLKVSKYHDYFTSCLPNSQKGNPVTLPIGGEAPLVYKQGGDPNQMPSLSFGLYGQNNKDMFNVRTHLATDVGNLLEPQGAGMTNQGEYINRIAGLENIYYTDLSQAVAATINAQRQAFAYQRILEKDARGGTRYREIIKQHFLVTSDDARQQVPEFICGKHIPMEQIQVAQTSEGTENSPQANLAAYGHTAGAYEGTTFSLTEHSVILGLVAVRTLHSYSQGLNRMWSRRRRLDLYWPALAHLGEQAVKNKEIFAQGNATDEETFGFQEAWAEYRYLPDLVTGEFRPDYEQSLDVWLYTDDFDSLPVLSKEFIEETPKNVDRTLAVQSKTADQFILNMQFKLNAVRPLPCYSIPGLIDHY